MVCVCVYGASLSGRAAQIELEADFVEPQETSNSNWKLTGETLLQDHPNLAPTLRRAGVARNTWPGLVVTPMSTVAVQNMFRGVLCSGPTTVRLNF